MDWLINSLINISIWQVAKFLIIVALLIFLVFAFVMVRQVRLMTKVVSGGFDSVVKIIGWVYFFSVVLVFFLALLIL